MDSCSSTLMQVAYNFKGSWDTPLPGAIQGLRVQSLSSELPEAPPSLHSPWEQPSLAQVWPSNPPPLPIWDGYFSRRPGKLTTSSGASSGSPGKEPRLLPRVLLPPQFC